MKTTRTFLSSFLERYLLAGILLLCFAGGLRAQNTPPLNISIQIAPPYPANIEDFLNRILFTVTVNDNTERQIYFVASITGSSGQAAGLRLDNSISASQASITIPATGTMFSWMTLENEYQGFGEEDFNIELTNGQRQLVLVERKFPQGDYQICLQAYEAGTNQVLSNSTCAPFDIIYYNPPQITIPNDDGHGAAILENPEDAFEIRWNPDPATSGRAVEYNVEIRRFLNLTQAQQWRQQNQLQDYIGSLELVREIPMINATSVNTLDENLSLNSGDILAIRVQAMGDGIDFINNGYSNIVVGFYGGQPGQSCALPAVASTRLVFPVAGDTLPYRVMPTVAFFEPQCSGQLLFNTTLQVQDQTDGSSGTQVRDRNWRSGPGPYHFLRKYIQDRGANPDDYWLPEEHPEYAGYMNLQDLRPDQPPTAYTRGHQYRISATGSLTYANQLEQESTQYLSWDELNSGGFTVGMPVPVLESPEMDATLEAGPVSLEWTSGEPPSGALTPPIKILNIDQNQSLMMVLGVQEKVVVQLSTTPEFGANDIVFCQLKKIQASAHNAGVSFDEDNPVFEPMPTENDFFRDRTYDVEQLRSKVYKRLQVRTDSLAEGTYYWRAGWLKIPETVNELHPCGLSNEQFYWFSPVRHFSIGDESIADEGCGDSDIRDIDGSTPGDDALTNCLQNILFPMNDVSQTPFSGALEPGAVIQAGHFDVTLKTVQAGNGQGRFSGTGEAPIDLGVGLGTLQVKFDFTNILINTERRLIEGQFTAHQDANPYSSGALSWLPRTVSGVTVQVPNAPTAQEATALINTIESSTERLISQLSGTPTGMPVGARVSNGTDFSVQVGIEDMLLKPDAAEMKMVAGLQLPGEFADQPVVFGMDKVKFSSQGIGEARLYLANDWTIGDAGDWQVQIEGLTENTDTIDATYVEWDCNGFKALNFKGSVVFHRDALVPENVTTGEVENNGQVRGVFRTRITRNQGWIAGLNFDKPFQFTALPGFGFTVSQAWLDFSDTQNPQDMRYPAGYDFRWLSPDSGADEPVTTPPAAALLNTWTGFYLRELSVRLPKDFADNGGNRIGFSVTDFMIDRNDKISGRIAATNLIGTGTPGVVGTWAFTLDEISVGIVQSATVSGQMRGKVGLPIFEANDFLQYQAVLSANTDNGQINFEFSIQPPQGRALHIPMWDIARMTLDPTTRVRIKIGAQPEFSFRLDGQLDFTGTPAGIDALRFDFPAVRVENLNFENNRLRNGAIRLQENGAWRTLWSLASPQKSMNGFPLSLERLILEPSGADGADLRLGMDLRLNLAGDFSAEADISVLADLGFKENGRISRFRIKEFLPPSRIAISAEMHGLELKGELHFKRIQENGTFREGTEGKLKVKIPGVGQIWLAAEFGTVKSTTVPTPAWETADFYPYFYVDGLFKSESGIDLLPPSLVLYGLGGGVRYHMRTASPLPDQNSRYAAALLSSTQTQSRESSESTTPPAAVARSEAQYAPDFGTFIGVTFRVVLGNTGGGQAYNLDVALSAEVSREHGLTHLGIDGYLNVMQSMNATGNAPVRAEVHIAYDKFPQSGMETTQGNILVYVNVLDVLKGAGNNDRFIDARFYADNKGKWYFYMGNPYKTEINGYPPEMVAGLKLGIAGKDLATLQSYIMIGQDIPGYLPPIDQEVEAVLSGGQLNQGRLNTQALNRSDGSQTPDYSKGEGFAFGSRFAVNARFEFLVFYAQLRMKLGFDVNITRDLNRVCAPTATTQAMTPGVNGWYAQGQMFAGLFGEMGLFVDLWFFKGNVKFVELAAAVAMKAKLPNPEYFQGRAGLYYSVLNGAISGYCNFNIELGTKCTITNPDPLRGVKLITDVQPAQGSNGTTVFAQPEAAFFVPINKVMEFSEEAPEDPNQLIVRRFRPIISDAKIEERGSNGTWTEVGNGYELKNQGLNARLLRTRILKPYTPHRVQIAVKVQEWIGDPSGSNGTWQDYTPPGNGPREEREIREWTSGDRPDFVRTEDVAFGFPGKGQRFFLQDEIIPSGNQTTFDAEFPADQSIIDFIRQDGPNGFAGLKENGYEYLMADRENYDYFARFTRLDDPSKTVNTAFLIRESVILFKLPRFANATYYYFELVRKEKKKTTQAPAKTPRGKGKQGKNSGTETVDLGEQNTVNIVRQKVLPHEVNPPQDEKILLKYYFRTSKYNSLAQKMANAQFQSPEVISTDREQLVAGLTGMDEPFDEFELNSMWDGTNLIASPFIQFNAPLTESIFTPYRANLNFYGVFSARIKNNFGCNFHTSHVGSPNCGNNAAPRIAYGNGFDCAFAKHFQLTGQYLWHDLVPTAINTTWTTDYYGNRVVNKCQPEIYFYYPDLNGNFAADGTRVVREYRESGGLSFSVALNFFGRGSKDFSDDELRTAAGISNALSNVLPIFNTQPASQVKKFNYDPWPAFKGRFEQLKPVLVAFQADRYNLQNYYNFNLPAGFFDKSSWVIAHQPSWSLRRDGGVSEYAVEFRYQLQFQRFVTASTANLSNVRKTIPAPAPLLTITPVWPVLNVAPPLNPVMGLSFTNRLNPFFRIP